MRVLELSTRQAVAGRSSFLASGEHFGRHNLEIEQEDAVNLVAVKKTTNKNLQGSHLPLPMLQDHGFESRSCHHFSTVICQLCGMRVGCKLARGCYFNSFHDNPLGSATRIIFDIEN